MGMTKREVRGDGRDRMAGSARPADRARTPSFFAGGESARRIALGVLIVAVLMACQLPTSMLDPFLTAAAPTSEYRERPTRRPAPTMEATAPALPSQPPPTSPPIVRPDPSSFVRWYFMAVWQDRDYSLLWTYTTSAFQAQNSRGGFADYTNWWNSVRRVDVHSVQVLHADANSARVVLDVTFVMKRGGPTRLGLDYGLVFDAYRATWMFDRAY